MSMNAAKSKSTGGCSLALRQSGVGLIEVMVAVLVLSIAFLGIAALQAMSLSTNNSAMARSMATIASYSMLDAMRADVTAAGNGDYNTSSALKANACPSTTTTLAQAQTKLWCNQLGTTLGKVASTTGNINCATTTDSTGNKSVACTITIAFDDSRAGNVDGQSNQTIVTKAML